MRHRGRATIAAVAEFAKAITGVDPRDFKGEDKEGEYIDLGGEFRKAVIEDTVRRSTQTESADSPGEAGVEG